MKMIFQPQKEYNKARKSIIYSSISGICNRTVLNALNLYNFGAPGPIVQAAITASLFMQRRGEAHLQKT